MATHAPTSRNWFTSPEVVCCPQRLPCRLLARLQLNRLRKINRIYAYTQDIRTRSLSSRAAGPSAHPAALKSKTPSRPLRQSPRPAISNSEIDPDALPAAIRRLFNDGESRDRETALRDLATILGFKRLGPVIKETLASGLLSATRRGILKNERGELSLLCRSIEDYERDFLKDQFLASLGRNWTERGEAGRAFARWLGFTRTGHAIKGTVRSLINGLVRERRLESESDQIRQPKA